MFSLGRMIAHTRDLVGGRKGVGGSELMPSQKSCTEIPQSQECSTLSPAVRPPPPFKHLEYSLRVKCSDRAPGTPASSAWLEPGRPMGTSSQPSRDPSSASGSSAPAGPELMSTSTSTAMIEIRPATDKSVVWGMRKWERLCRAISLARMIKWGVLFHRFSKTVTTSLPQPNSARYFPRQQTASSETSAAG